MDYALFSGAIFLFLTIVLSLVFYFFLQKRNKEIIKEREESGRRLYELAILKELGERVGYSLNVEEILAIITGSLRQFIDYTVVGYVVVGPEKIKVNMHLEQSVSEQFLEEMKEKMLASLSALLAKDLSGATILKNISGAIIISEIKDKIGSLFNIPLVIGGSVVGVLSVAHRETGLYKEEDMTILYKITAQASKAVERLQAVVDRENERINKIREEYTNMIVHELRSPLDSMKKIMELIIGQEDQKEIPKFKEYLDMVYQNSSSMLELVNDILDFSKLQAGKFEVNKERANLKELVENRISFYKISANSKKISLEAKFDPNLPETCFVDPQAFKQILNNFISNSLKFTKAGGLILISAFLFDSKNVVEKDSKIPIFPSAKDLKSGAPSICIVVSDNGVGIPEASLKDLFQTYKQAKLSPVDKETKGTGLGLVIARGIAEAHGGSVGVVSKEGLGSSFFFTIPLS